MPEPVLAVRTDRWLVAARIFKTRSLAQLACSGGRVKVDGNAVKASRVIRRGETLTVESERGQLVLVVRELAERRLSAPLAKELYDDHSPPPPPKEERIAVRERGAGRPTKAERRALDRFRSD